MGATAAEWGSPTLGVVIPAFDEAASIGWALRAMRQGLQRLEATDLVASTEIVVVDDHSSDATPERIAEAAELPGPLVRQVEAEGSRGLGSAIRRGFAETDADLVLYTDADLPFDPAELPRMVGVLRRYEADVLCGYRHDRTVEGTRRALQSHVYNALVRAALPVRVRDVNFACKLFRRAALDAVAAELRSDGPFIDAELVARLSHHDLRVVQLGVDYFPRFDTASTLGGPAAIADIVREGWRLRRELRSGR